MHGSNYGFNLNFLVINDVSYVFIVATHVSSLMTCLFRYLTLFFFWTCWEGYGILVPQPRIESGLQQWKSGILTKLSLFYIVFNWIVFLLLTLESSLYIVDRRPFLAMYFANISSQSSCLFIFLVNFCIFNYIFILYS